MHSNIIIKGNKIARVEEFSITLNALENQIKNMRYLGNMKEYNKKFDNLLENDSIIKIPTWAEAFYNFILLYMRVPRQCEFWEWYITYNSNYIKCNGENVTIQYITTNYTTKSIFLKSRMLRAYPSLLREFHFFVSLKDDKEMGNDVSYSLKDDFSGTDVKIGDIELALYVQSPRSNSFRKIKKDSHLKSKAIDFPLILSDGMKLGTSNIESEKFILYPHSYIEKVRELYRSGWEA